MRRGCSATPQRGFCRFALCAGVFFALATLAACAENGDDRSVAIRACAPVELAIDDVPAVDNPFDPEQVDVQVTFTGPDGSTWSTAAFFTRSYQRTLIGGFEHLNPTDEGEWRVRFTPPRAGTWRWQAQVRGTAATTAERTFACEPDATSHGALRRSTTDPHALVWEDGTPYVAIGENLCWYDGRGTFAYDDWLDKLHARKANWIRLWMPSWAFGLEWTRRNPDGSLAETSLGNYRTRLDRAWQLDYVIEAARQRGMVVMLAIQNHGAFSLVANSEWADNPYNAANGGPLDRPHDLYTDAEARRLFAQRLRYIVARWGYAPNLIWEFWNEVDLADAQPAADVIEWHASMGRLLRELDPYDRLITSSVALQLGAGGALNPVWLPLWNLADIDLAQIHLYGIGLLAPVDFSTVLPRMTADLRAQTGKPVLVGEAGVDARGPAETLSADPKHRGLHELIWSGLFAGGFGTGMTWWWDNVIDPEDQYGQLDGVLRLTDGIAWDQETFTTDASSVHVDAATNTLRALPLIGTKTVLVWVRNAAHVWYQPDLSLVTRARLHLTNLAAGDWSVVWLDPLSGAVVDSTMEAVGDSELELAIPDLHGEIALRLERTEG